MTMPQKTVRVMPWEMDDAIEPMTLRELAEVATSLPWEPSSFQRCAVRTLGQRLIFLLDDLEQRMGPMR